MKRILTQNRSVLGRLSMVVIMLLFAVVCAGQFAGGTGTQNSPWRIANAEHLNNVRNYLGEEHNDKFFIQTANIDLTEATREGGAYWNGGEGWLAIGSFSEEEDLAFYGTYNGGNHTISGIFINRPEANYNGLFGYVFAATISNLSVLELNITGGAYYTSPLVARSNGEIIEEEESITTITNCHTSGSVTSTGRYTAGMVGSMGYTTIANCSSSCTITANDRYSGGMVGYARYNCLISNSHTTGNVTGGDLEDSYSGGFIGFAYTTTVIANCYNTGDVRAGGRWIGGFAGRIQGNTEAINCYNTGNLIATSAGDYAGGFTGWTYSNTRLINCFNTGGITSTATRTNVGGLVGYLNSGSVYTDCYNTGDVNVTNSSYVGGLVGRVPTLDTPSSITNCYSAGLVRGRSGVGGFIGSRQGAPQIVNCYFDREKAGTTTSAGGTAKTTAEMTYRPDLYVNYPHYDPSTYGDAWGIGDERHNGDIWYPDTEYVYDVNPDNIRPGFNNGYPVFFYQVIPEEILDAPVVTIKVTYLEDAPYIKLTWEAVENAQSYKVFASDSASTGDWGDPIAVVEETEHSELIGERGRRFYYVVASTREAR